MVSTRRRSAAAAVAHDEHEVAREEDEEVEEEAEGKRGEAEEEAEREEAGGEEEEEDEIEEEHAEEVGREWGGAHAGDESGDVNDGEAELYEQEDPDPVNDGTADGDDNNGSESDGDEGTAEKDEAVAAKRFTTRGSPRKDAAVADSPKTGANDNDNDNEQSFKSPTTVLEEAAVKEITILNVNPYAPQRKVTAKEKCKTASPPTTGTPARKNPPPIKPQPKPTPTSTNSATPPLSHYACKCSVKNSKCLRSHCPCFVNGLACDPKKCSCVTCEDKYGEVSECGNTPAFQKAMGSAASGAGPVPTPAKAALQRADAKRQKVEHTNPGPAAFPSPRNHPIPFIPPGDAYHAMHAGATGSMSVASPFSFAYCRGFTLEHLQEDFKEKDDSKGLPISPAAAAKVVVAPGTAATPAEKLEAGFRLVVREAFSERAAIMSMVRWPYSPPVCGVVRNFSDNRVEWLVEEWPHSNTEDTWQHFHIKSSKCTGRPIGPRTPRQCPACVSSKKMLRKRFSSNCDLFRRTIRPNTPDGTLIRFPELMKQKIDVLAVAARSTGAIASSTPDSSRKGGGDKNGGTSGGKKGKKKGDAKEGVATSKAKAAEAATVKWAADRASAEI